MQRSVLSAVLVPFLALATACAAPGANESSSSPAEPAEASAPTGVAEPWRSAFPEEAGLIAETVEVFGGPGLRAHMVIGHDAETQDMKQEATNDGLRTRVSAKPGAGVVAIRAQIDELRITATRQLVVLESPNSQPVRVRAAGDVFLVSGGQSQNLPAVELVGAAP